jgi:hypothetical protein
MLFLFLLVVILSSVLGWDFVKFKRLRTRLAVFEEGNASYAQKLKTSRDIIERSVQQLVPDNIRNSFRFTHYDGVYESQMTKYLDMLEEEAKEKTEQAKIDRMVEKAMAKRDAGKLEPSYPIPFIKEPLEDWAANHANFGTTGPLPAPAPDFPIAGAALWTAVRDAAGFKPGCSPKPAPAEETKKA